MFLSTETEMFLFMPHSYFHSILPFSMGILQLLRLCHLCQLGHCYPKTWNYGAAWGHLGILPMGAPRQEAPDIGDRTHYLLADCTVMMRWYLHSSRGILAGFHHKHTDTSSDKNMPKHQKLFSKRREEICLSVAN